MKMPMYRITVYEPNKRKAEPDKVLTIICSNWMREISRLINEGYLYSRTTAVDHTKPYFTLESSEVKWLKDWQMVDLIGVDDEK